MSNSLIPSMKPNPTPTPANTTSENGCLWFNVQDFGAKGDATQDDGPAIQACIDALAEAQKTMVGPGVVFLPQGRWGYLTNTPIFMDKPNQTMIGGGGGCRIKCNGANPAIYLGIKRDKPTDPSRFPSSVGILDNSAGQHYGQKLGGESSIEFQANGFQYGMMTSPNTYDYWNMSKFTFEFCIDINGSSAFIFGMGDWQNTPSFCVSVTGEKADNLNLTFRTDDTPINRYINFPIADSNSHSPIRITIQGDLDAGRIVAFINDKSVAGVYGELPGSYKKPWGPGLKLAANDSVLFKIGGDKPDFTIYGLRLSNICRYVDPGIGNSLPNTPQDKVRYFTGDANTIAYLTLGRDDYMSQFVGYWNQGGSVGKAIRTNKNNKPWNKNIGIKNIRIDGNTSAGTGITHGNIFGLVIDNVKSFGLIGLASHPLECTYPMSLTNCELGGWDCALFGYFLILKSINLNITQAGRDAIRCVSCDSDWDTTFVGSPSTDTVFKYLTGGYGSIVRMVNTFIDFEGYAVNTAIVLAENCSYVPSTTLTLENFFIGTVGDVPCIKLRDMADAKVGVYKKAWLSVENVSTWGPYRCFVETDGPLWAGVVNAYFLDEKNLLNHVPTWGDHSNITFTNVGLAPK